ncbi:hypothetical protein PanWU01x14_063890 [Parasponia andersonii]|uniref:Tetratricopeptide-like helical domain containing protein n=1 Tax=Parasponia andersonii TaxID=3476 RepID=A0A2P5DH94_PARAD|nr:hypothetical protein PanWU01x14_063890 [Parasponia andersonii]
MDHALLLCCGNSRFFPQASIRSKIISSRNFTKPLDLNFFRSKYSTSTSTTPPLISSRSLTNSCSTPLTVGHPQGINARPLIGTTLPRFSSAHSSSSDHHDGDNGIFARASSFRAGVGAAPLALSCVLSILSCGSMIQFMNPSKAIAQPQKPYSSQTSKRDIITNAADESKSISPMSGTDTMRAFLHEIMYLSKSFPTFNKDTYLAALQKETLELIKDGKSDEAVEKLKEECRALSAPDPERKRYVEFLLVEILISRGDYEEASKLECLKDNRPSDVRPELYKVLSHIRS